MTRNCYRHGARENLRSVKGCGDCCKFASNKRQEYYYAGRIRRSEAVGEMSNKKNQVLGKNYN